MYILRKTALLSLILAMIFTGPVSSAQTPAPGPVQPADETVLFEDIPMVYSASRMEESILEAPAAMSVINSKNLRDWGIVDVPDAFRRVPGMDVIAFDGRTWGVSARGFNERWARRMLVLVDGMSVYTQLFSGVDWDMLPLLVDDIDKIEIVRGANDTLYGFNAFNGVINIDTKDPEDTHGFFGKYIYGSFNRNQYIGRYGDHLDLGRAGDLDFRAAYSLDSSLGYGDKYGHEFADKENVQIITSRAKYTIGEGMNAEFMFGLNTGLRNTSPVVRNNNPAMNYANFEFENGKLNLIFSEDHTAYIQAYRWKQTDDYKRISNGLDSDDKKQVQYNIEFQDSFSLFDGRSRTVWGASYRHNDVESLTVKRIPEGNQKQWARDDLASGFVNEKLILIEDMDYVEKLALVGGLRAEWSHLTRETDFAPRVSLMYTPVKDNVFRATYARAYRLPSFLEVYDTAYIPANTGSITRVRGNENLKPETVDSYELGYSGVYYDGKLGFDADLFLAEYRGMVTTFQSQAASFFPVARPFIADFNNNSKAHSAGIELAVSCKPWKWLDCYANYTYENIRDTRAGNPQTLIYKSGTPENKANIGVTVKLEKDTIEGMPFLGGTTFNINANMRDSYIFFNDSDVPRSEFDIKNHCRLDLRLAKAFFEDNLELAFIGQNLLDENYEARWVTVPQEILFTVTVKGWPWDWEIAKKKK